MQNFSDRLTAARKAKGMTQEELARSINVARNTISSWEHGRTVPDIDTARRLSEVLEIDLTHTEPSEEAPTAERPETENVETAPTGKRVRKWWIIAAAAVLVCAVVLCVIIFSRDDAPKGGESAFDPAYYTQEVPNDVGKAYLAFDNKTWEDNNSENEFQYYVFNIIEKNGIGFSISRVEVRMEGKNGAIRDITMTADDLVSFLLDPDLPPYGAMPLQGGHPKGEFLRVGITVYGSDANGAPMVFYSMIEF